MANQNEYICQNCKYFDRNNISDPSINVCMLNPPVLDPSSSEENGQYFDSWVRPRVKRHHYCKHWQA